jgi:uncharacterized protein YeaO (DUF488 family)
VIQVNRAYHRVSKNDGARFLVERLWPRGIKKVNLDVEDWLKDVAPSSELRQWFHHDPAKWAEFRHRHFRQLERNPDTWQPLLARARWDMVTLVYSSHDTEHNNAVALKEFLDHKLRGKGPDGETCLERGVCEFGSAYPKRGLRFLSRH